MKMDGMTQSERRTAMALSGIFATRMLGLFMILPVFAIYATTLEGQSEFLAGVAIGIYGLTQAVFQIPMGMLSDKIGRKPVIIGGLIVFALGSLIAALADDITWIIIGRAIQGSGAIAAVVMALASDLTREEHRMKVMAIIGMSIGFSFALAMVLGPVLQGIIGVPGIFLVTVFLAIGGILVVKFLVPTPSISSFHRDTELETKNLSQILFDPQLLRLDIGIFILHMVLTATFLAIPKVLQNNLNILQANHWQIYLPVLLGSMILLVPFIIYAERKRKLKQVFSGAILLLGLSVYGMWSFSQSVTGIVLMLLLFFTAFNLLEASLPSLVAKIAPATKKGTAMGVYSSSQFLGIFAGGLIAGKLSELYGFETIFILNMGFVAVWLLLAISMKQPGYLSTQLLHVGQISESEVNELASQLLNIRGVAEATVIAQDSVAYLKVDKKLLDQDSLWKYSSHLDL
ncbi:Inner membrane transport protein YajR [hydrothermal vent metagenome]|uniref:Inner membrane transport protein YajR n=1 Tax=hydrothermal vent metagenome TaxID=652676 RepID=A0A3B0ZRX6_9ZZZZ